MKLGLSGLVWRTHMAVATADLATFIGGDQRGRQVRSRASHGEFENGFAPAREQRLIRCRSSQGVAFRVPEHSMLLRRQPGAQDTIDALVDGWTQTSQWHSPDCRGCTSGSRQQEQCRQSRRAIACALKAGAARLSVLLRSPGGEALLRAGLPPRPLRRPKSRLRSCRPGGRAATAQARSGSRPDR